MDEALIRRIEAQLVEEGERRSPPPEWPVLPDLPVGRYTDEDLFRLETDVLFRRTWVYAGHESELPEPGSYIVFDRTGSPILIVRGKDRVIRAFYNTCRHRNAPVVHGSCGTARRLVCTFHSWSYDLDGALVAVPDEYAFAGLDRSERGLVPVRCETWLGFIFVNEDPQAQPLVDFLGPVAREMTPEYDGQPLRIVHRRRLTLPCNWKVVVEAFLEVYHLRTVHPKTLAPYLDGKASAIALFPNGHSRMVTRALVTEGRKAGHEGLPSMPTVSRLIRETSTSYLIFPNVVTPLGHAGFPLLLAWPRTVDTTDYEWIYFALDWGEGDAPAAWEQRMALFDSIMDEDMNNVEPIQRSLSSLGARGIPLSWPERRIWHFDTEVDRAIGPDRVPAALRVPPLIDHLVEA
ncbi:MAG: Rieske 2Fe-2S domain-containing protein [Actinobacteria bacterium]|nr:Rieske 2Fe-2S domain-containing protein [Actinomycetota bacterium]